MYRYALLDTAPIEGWHLKLQNRRISFCSLFAAQPEENFLEISPLLIPLDDISQQDSDWLTKELTRLGHKYPALHWLQSQHATAQLAAHLQNFHTIKLVNGKTLMLRWYDTRVLPEWLALLEPKQREQFLSGLSAWQYINRVGDNAALECSTVNTPLAAVRIELDAAQTAKLLRIGEADALITELRKIIPTELARVDPRSLHMFVQQQLDLANQLGLESQMQKVTWLLLALHTGGEFSRTNEGRALLATLPQQASNFEINIEKLSEAVWQSGRPFWES